MEHNSRDITVTKKILREINDIESFVADMTEEELNASLMAQKAIVMSLINIGELSKSYTEPFRDAHASIPWRDIRGLRNLAAHHYEAIDMHDIWKTIKDDIPILKQELT